MGSVNARYCKCGHTLSDHYQKTLVKDKKLVKKWRGECEDFDCPCQGWDEAVGQ